MIIENIKINIFAGLTNKDIGFENGVNVLLGPNEAGKSTIFNVIENALFTPTNLTPAKFGRQLGRFLPIGGGDTIDVEIAFSKAGEEYKLWRSWGSTAATKLTLPSGAVITENEEVQKKIESCLQLSEGTCKHVMMTYQSGLSDTIAELRSDTNTMQSFGDLLRAVVMEMDGVSVDALKVAVEEKFKHFTSLWNFDDEFPENNRGVNNPYVKGHGSIVKAFYANGNIKKQLESAKSFELEMDRLNGQIRNVLNDLITQETFLKDNKKAHGDAAKRSRLNSSLESLELKIEKLKLVNKTWPIAEQKIKDANTLLPKLTKKESAFSQEKINVQIAENNRDLLSKYERAKAKKMILDESEDRLKKAAKLSASDLKKIRDTVAEISNLESSLSAGKLYIKFTTQSALDLAIQSGFTDQATHHLKPGEAIELSAEGRMQIMHRDWTLEATSGEGNYEDLLKQHDSAKQSLIKLLREIKVDSVEQAETVHTKYARHLQEVETAKDNLTEALGEETFADLEKSVNEIDSSGNVRKMADVVEDLVSTQNEIKSLEKERDEYAENIHAWEEEYTDTDSLLLDLAEFAGDKKDKTKEINELASLPEGMTAEEFIENYDQAEEDYKDVNDEKHTLIQEKLQLEAGAPESSVEELEREQIEAENTFNQELKKGKTILRIREAMNELLEEMDTSTYEGFHSDVANYIAKMTDKRYSNIEMDESLPAGVNRSDGELITYENLSRGTQDVLSIALRLAMVDKYLKDKEGFLILDDPFVDLDPRRQELAVNVIKDFAKDKQVILFTCHPSHAELLGGNKIQLN
ncbi:MAG: AAA family ATPase [Candidatus Marinimicrobia bacterium]|nr:AAA family ATPase [Candidatus Neomarinimicrobiota bacterium]